MAGTQPVNVIYLVKLEKTGLERTSSDYLSFPAFQSKNTTNFGGMRNLQNFSETKDIKKILMNIVSTMEPLIILLHNKMTAYLKKN